MPDLIPIDDIVVDGELNFPEEIMKPIRESIAEQGLHHPLLVVSFGYVDDGGNGFDQTRPGYKLIAGKKRLLALKQLGTREALVKVYKDLSTDQLFEISLHENLKRYNLPWHELVETELILHELRLKIHGQRKKGTPRLSAKGKQGWTQADTARELGIAVGVLSEDLDLARAVASNPSLKKVKDRTTALKLIRVQARRQDAQAFAMIEPDFEMNQVFYGDSLDILKQLPDKTFDACITDPPWSVYSKGEGEVATLVIEQKELLPIFEQVFRVLKSDSFLYLVVSSPDLLFYHVELPKLGFKVQKHALIWHKPNRAITNFGRAQWEYSRDYEPIIVAVKGSPVLTMTVEASAILPYNGVHYTRTIHPNEKPIELLKKLIGDCSYDNSCILDPFAGSGVTLQAAKELRRNYIGIEKEHKFYQNIVRRLNG